MYIYNTRNTSVLTKLLCVGKYQFDDEISVCNDLAVSGGIVTKN